MPPKILVIGSRDHGRADCVDWLQPFPNIEEYDSIVINLRSLTPEILGRLRQKILQMRESIVTVFHTKRENFYIINEFIHPPPAPRPPGKSVFKGVSLGYIPNTNYDWLPTKIKVDNSKKGTSINLHNHRFYRYFECIDKWSLEISISLGATTQDKIAFLVYGFVPIATNKSEKTIAGSLNLGGVLFGGKIQGKGAIHLLPPPTKCDIYRAIEMILDMIYGEEGRIIPPWREDIEVPKIEEFEQEIENKIGDIKRSQQEISQLRNQIQEWDSYRDLLTSTGYDLESIVQKALSDIGIKTKTTEKGFPVDLIGNDVAVEITGIKGCVGVSSEKVNQTGRFKESYHKREKIILIANTHMDFSPKDREGKMDFSPEVKKYFEALSVCCLTTKTLFQLWKDVVTKKKDSKDVARKILSKNGELTLSEFE